MLQIISGKFFKKEDRHIHHGKGILYSNYSWVAPIETCIGTLEPVDTYRAVSAYVFSYINQIEKYKNGVGELIRVGDEVILRQFQLFCTLGLQSFFHFDKEAILTNCRKGPVSSTDMFTPSRFVPRIFDEGTTGTPNEVKEFTNIVEKAISLSRTDYVSVISVLENLDHSLQVLRWNIDLAYSMLIYCLESLSQAHDKYVPRWENYDNRIRTKLDALLDRIPGHLSEQVRETLLIGSHQKLLARFVDFTCLHLGEEFYTTNAQKVSKPLRRSETKRALQNAYKLRSSYVHQLSPIDDLLRYQVFGKDEVVSTEEGPHLTFAGLLRIVLHVIKKFIWSRPRVEKEEFNWRSALPGTIRVSLPPQYWISASDGIDKQTDRQALSRSIQKKFSGFIQHIITDVLKKGGAIQDMRALLEKYENLIPSSKKRERVRMLVIYELYNRLVEDTYRSNNWEKFITRWEAESKHCCLEAMIMNIILTDSLTNFSYEECRNEYLSFLQHRYSKGALTVPLKIELKLQIELANMALSQGKTSEYLEAIEMAVGDAAGMYELQEELIAARASPKEIDHHRLLPLCHPRGQ